MRPSLIGLVDVAREVAGDVGFPDNLLEVLAEFIAASVELRWLEGPRLPPQVSRRNAVQRLSTGLDKLRVLIKNGKVANPCKSCSFSRLFQT